MIWRSFSSVTSSRIVGVLGASGWRDDAICTKKFTAPPSMSFMAVIRLGPDQPVMKMPSTSPRDMAR